MFRIFVTTLTGLVFFWTIASIFLVIDFTGGLKQYKVVDTKNEHATKKEIIKAISTTVFNQLVFGVGQTTLWYYFIANVQSPHENDDLYAVPTFGVLIRDLLVTHLVVEFTFYPIHRLMHWKPIYNRVHKVHHEWKAPIAVASIYNHPLELLTGSFFPFVAGPLLMRSHVCTVWILNLMTYTTVVTEHSGYQLPFLKSAQFHHYHHTHIDQCFGAFGVLDYIFGTDTKFRNSVEFTKHRLFYRLKKSCEKSE